jgi:hypothetical protein
MLTYSRHFADVVRRGPPGGRRATRRSPWRRQTSYESPTRADRAGASAPRLELLHRGVSRHRCPYVTHPAAATTESVLFKSGLKWAFRHILAQSLFFKAPYVWDDRRPRPRAKLRSPCRAVAYVHDRRLDAASDGRVTAVLPV